MSDLADSVQYFWAISDQIDTFEWGGDLPVFDEVALGEAKDKISIGDIDLASGEANGIDPFLYRANNVFGVVFAGKHVGIGHARHWGIMKALASAAAACWLAKVLGRESVV